MPTERKGRVRFGKVVETGQVVEMPVARRGKRKQGWRERVGQIDYIHLARLEMSGLEGRIFAAVMAHVPPHGGTDAFCTMQDIADMLGVQQTSVARAMRGLKERHIVWLVKQGKWHVNAWLTYNGAYEQWNAEYEKDPEPIWTRGVNTETGEVR